MNTKTSKLIFYAVCTVLVLAVGFLSGKLYCAVTQNETVYYRLIRPQVYDATTGKAIKNATVTRAYDGVKYLTDDDGSTEWMSVTYKEGEETTLAIFIAQAKGYKTTLLYMVCETDSEPLEAPHIYLFSGDSSQSVSMVYSPHDEYNRELIERFTQND